jgi:hypothetical protein
MMNHETMAKHEAHTRHPERSEAESKDPVKLLFGLATGFLDFARNDKSSIRHLSFVLRHSNHA